MLNLIFRSISGSEAVRSLREGPSAVGLREVNHQTLTLCRDAGWSCRTESPAPSINLQCSVVEAKKKGKHNVDVAQNNPFSFQLAPFEPFQETPHPLEPARAHPFPNGLPLDAFCLPPHPERPSYFVPCRFNPFHLVVFEDCGL